MGCNTWEKDVHRRWERDAANGTGKAGMYLKGKRMQPSKAVIPRTERDTVGWKSKQQVKKGSTRRKEIQQVGKGMQQVEKGATSRKGMQQVEKGSTK